MLLDLAQEDCLPRKRDEEGDEESGERSSKNYNDSFGRESHRSKARDHKKLADNFEEGSPERVEHLYAARMHLGVADSPYKLTPDHKMRGA